MYPLLKRISTYASFLAIILFTSFSFGQTSSITGVKKDIKEVKQKLQAVSSSDPWSVKQVITPDELLKQMKEPAAKKPLIIQVGFDILYNQGHIPGAVYAGPASRTEGIARLKDAVKKVNKKKDIVVYCGCCGWSDCPNVRPAFKTLSEMGFKNLKVLYLPHDFQRDWKDKKLPVSK